MQMNDTQRIPAPRAAVWAALNDPEVLKACIPGCESLEKTAPTEMTAKVTLKVGPVKATFGGRVTLDHDRPAGVVLFSWPGHERGCIGLDGALSAARSLMEDAGVEFPIARW